MAILEGSSGKEKVKSVVCISYYGHLGNTQFKWLREPRFLFLLQVDSIATGLFSILVKSLVYPEHTYRTKVLFSISANKYMVLQFASMADISYPEQMKSDNT